MNAERFDIDQLGNGGTELARYSAEGIERVLMAWRREDGIEVTDRPAEGTARAYLVDRGFRCGEELVGFMSHYLDEARRTDACPMSPEGFASLLDPEQAIL